MEARYKLIPLSPTEVARELNSNPATSQHAPELLLIDIRPNGQYCSNHIKQAENLNFSNILLRRLLKRVITLDAMISSPELAEKVCGGRCYTAQKLVLCDTSSTAEGIKPDLAKHAEVLCTDCTGRCTALAVSAEQQVAYFIDGKRSYSSSRRMQELVHCRHASFADCTMHARFRPQFLLKLWQTLMFQ